MKSDHENRKQILNEQEIRFPGVNLNEGTHIVFI